MSKIKGELIMAENLGYLKEIFPSFNSNIEKNPQVVKDINNNLIVINPDDHLVSRDILKNGVWERNINYVLEKIVKEGNVVLNLGTHIGFHTIHMSKLVGDTGTVHSFEANSIAYKYLLANLFVNNIKNVVTYNKAAYSENTELKFVGFNAVGLNQGGSYVMPSDDSVRENSNYWKPMIANADIFMVEAAKIDDVLTNVPKIDIIQMDIEGCEPKAMYGALNLIARSDNLIVIQEWDISHMSSQSNVLEYLGFWRNQGYEFAAIPKKNNDFILETMTDEQLIHFWGDVVIAKDISLVNENFFS